MIQVNELCHELAYRGMSDERRRNLSWAANTSINMGSGLTAGVAAAILSQVRRSLLRPIPVPSVTFTESQIRTLNFLLYSRQTPSSRKSTRGMVLKVA